MSNQFIERAWSAVRTLGRPTALHWLFGILTVLEEEGQPEVISSAAVLEYLRLDPPNDEWQQHSLEDLFDKDQAGGQLLRAFGIHPSRWHQFQWEEFDLEGEPPPKQENDWQELLNKFTRGKQLLARLFRQSDVDPEKAIVWLRSQTPETLIPLHFNALKARLREVYSRPEVLLCFWHTGLMIPMPSVDSNDHHHPLVRPGRSIAGALPPRAIHVVLESLRVPAYQADFAPFREQLSRFTTRAMESTDVTELYRQTARRCLKLNVLPHPLHLAWTALELDDPLLNEALPDREALLLNLETAIFGHLPDGPLELRDGKLCQGPMTLLILDDAYHKAESLVGLGRVNRWVNGRLFIHASQGAVDSIELRN